ncbi:DUF3348 family protein [Chondromyces apiculatus]|uniref:Uncharacterized protein n=1 Tax=Chondromyces apiculatus DSM 436 TaxID=1192034 RepID=A0A017SU45_9BACT|nr:DUF3348 family protein [Chondromyces apiculatus]EYF00105.1 Hypothetical protein CAP_1370 [Chondromyces apiculatus DSM 436]
MAGEAQDGAQGGPLSGPLSGPLGTALTVPTRGYAGTSLATTASALVPLPLTPSRGRGRLAVPAPKPPEDPAEHLARLMDLHGSVALAQVLGPADAPLALPPVGQRRASGAAAAALRAVVEDRLKELASTLRRTFEEPFHRRNRLPGAVEMLDLLTQVGALGPAGRRVSAAAAGTVWEPFGELLGRLFGRIRYEVQSLRAEVGPGLRVLGPELGRLERLDAVIGAATEKGRERVLGALAPALGQCFGQGLQQAVGALPEEPVAADVARWFDEMGWIRLEMERMRRVVEAVFTHQTRRLVALVEASHTPGRS